MAQEGRRRSPRTVVVRWAALAVLAVVAVVFGRDWLEGKLAQQISDMGGQPAGGVIANLSQIVSGKWGANSSGRTIPELQFNIKSKDIQKLANKREEALKIKYLIQEPGDFVTANITVRDAKETKIVPADIRLKGDATDHLEGEKWSFRVRTKGNSEILGMRVFSIQHPRVRGYAHEPLILDHMRREGLLAPRYFFVRVSVNGRDKGIMALEEHFSKELLESQQRRESVIVRFDESLVWRTLHLMGQTVNFAAPYPLVKPFRGAVIAKNPQLQRDLESAIGLLRSFLTKELKPSEVFDPELTARFLAVAEIWGAEHALAWNNLRFYYNPITGLLEPVIFDANLQDYAFQYIPTALVSVYRLGDHMSADWLEDPRIQEPFLRALQRISREFLTEETLAKITEREDEICGILHREFPLIAKVPLHFYRMRAERLTRVDADNFRILPLMPPNYPALLHAFVRPSPAGFVLELYNLVPYPIEVTGLAFDPVSVSADTSLPIRLPRTPELTTPVPARIELQSPDNPAKVKVKVSAHIPGYPGSKTISSRIYSAPATEPILPDPGWKEVLGQHPYLKRIDDKNLTLGPGLIEVDTPLILPRGAELTVLPGTTLSFASTALLLVRGCLRMEGTQEAPIRLKPQGSSWPGLAIVRATTPSIMKHVHVIGTAGLAHGTWRATGGVMVYESKITMAHCTFEGNQSEDALNFVRSEFDLDDITVRDAKSDAIDADFCKGVVRNCFIDTTGGDAIDVSGTEIKVIDAVMKNIKDKALSVGEQSTMTASGVRANNVGTGLASKDGSFTRIENSTFEGVEYAGITAYTKKPEFGPGRVSARDVKIIDAKHDHLAQIGSSIEVDGKQITPVKLDVDGLYKTGEMKKPR